MPFFCLLLLGSLASAGGSASGACARHADCAAQHFCGQGSQCRDCATVTPASCTTYDGSFCCNTTFLQQCSANPFACVTRDVPTGGAIAASQSLLDFVVREALPLLEDTMLNLDPLDFSGSYDWGLLAYFSALGITVEELKLGQVSAALTPTGSIRLEITGLDLSVRVLGLMAVQPLVWPIPDITCTGASRAAIPGRGGYPGHDPLPPVEVSGGRLVPWSVRNLDPWFSADVGTASPTNRISIELDVGYNRFTGAPTVASSRATCSLDSVSVSTHFSTVCSWISTLAQFLAGDVESLVCAQLVEAAQNFTLHNVNEMLSGLELTQVPLPVPDMPAYDVLALDASLTAAPEFSPGSSLHSAKASPFLGVGMHAAFLNRVEPVPPMPWEPPSTIGNELDGRMLSAAVSTWTLESLMYVVHRSGLLNATVTKDMLPGAVANVLESNGPTWFSIAPVLYNRDPPVDMAVLARSAGSRDSNEGVPTLSMANGLLTMQAPIELIFQVDPAAASPAGHRRAESTRSAEGGQGERGEPEELFALGCPLELGMTLGVEAAVEPPPSAPDLPQRRSVTHGNSANNSLNFSSNHSSDGTLGGALPEAGAPTTRVTMGFSFAKCEVELLRSNVGEVNIGGPLFGLQQQLNTIILPALVLYVNSMGAEGFLLPSLMGFSAVNALLDLHGDRASLGIDLAFSAPPVPPPPPPPAPVGCSWADTFFWNPSTRTSRASRCAQSEGLRQAQFNYEYQSSNGSGDHLALSYGQCDTQAACVDGAYRNSACQWQSELTTQDTQRHALGATVTLNDAQPHLCIQLYCNNWLESCQVTVGPRSFVPVN